MISEHEHTHQLRRIQFVKQWWRIIDNFFSSPIIFIPLTYASYAIILILTSPCLYCYYLHICLFPLFSRVMLLHLLFKCHFFLLSRCLIFCVSVKNIVQMRKKARIYNLASHLFSTITWELWKSRQNVLAEEETWIFQF